MCIFKHQKTLTFKLKVIMKFTLCPRQHDGKAFQVVNQQCLTVLTCIQGDVGRVYHLIFQAREEWTPLCVRAESESRKPDAKIWKV